MRDFTRQPVSEMRLQRTIHSPLHALVLCLILLIACPAAAQDFTVVIDAGHGGHDAGAVGSISKEKNINLNIALKLGKLIEKQLKDTKVIYTRKTDVFIPLNRRAEIANDAKANLFISIHTNSVANKAKSPQGVETYSLGLARSEDNLEVAKRENSVILMEEDYKTRYAGFNPNSSESYIIFEFMQDKYMEQSVHMASLVQEQMKGYCKRVNKGVKQAGFLVLRETSMPSVLIEVGFISNKQEERYLNTSEGTDNLAQGIFRAFKQYKKEYDLRTKKAKLSSPSSQSRKVQASAAQPEQNIRKSSPDSQTGTAETTTGNKKTTRNTSDDEIRFKIQILATSSLLKSNDKRLKGLSPVDYYEEQGLYKYTYGSSSDYNEIYRLRKTILDRFSSAFIIAFRGDEKMNVNEAIRLFKAKRK